MRRTTTTKRLLARAAAVLALATFASPTDLWATGGTIAGNGTKASPYLLEDAADWATFTNSSNAATYWASGVYVKMTADIGTAESPVTTMVGTTSSYYYGNFDGDGHTLTVALTNTSTAGLAPFMRVSGAGIYQLSVAGSVRPGSQYYASGLVGQIQGDGTTIRNCRSSVSIEYNSGTGNCWSAGLVGNGQSYTFTIVNSMFDGSIGYVEGGTGTLQYMAGILAWSAQYGHPTIINCLNAGTFQSANLSKILLLHGSNTSAVITNCYSTTDASSNGTYYDARGTYTTATGGELAALLGNNFEVSGGVLTPKTGLTNLGTCTITGVNDYYFNDGTMHQPEPIVTDIFGTVLTEGTDYNVDWNGDGTTAGDYTVTVTGRGSYSGAASANYTVTDGLAVTSASYSTDVTWEDGYIYKVYADAEIYNRITVKGSVRLILGEGATLTAVRGISVEDGKTLTIQGSGTLTVNATNGNAGIGGSSTSGAAGTIIINSGTINATGYYGGAGIGGHQLQAAGTIIINGGIVNATGADYGAGIGGGGGQATNKPGAGGTITINGGQVTATSASGFGIGYGKRDTGSVDGDAGTITLGWTNADDFINAKYYAGTVTLAKDFYYNGTTTGVLVSELTETKDAKLVPSTAETDYNLEFATISGVASSYLYTGSAIGITPTVKDFRGNTLTEGTHYTVSYTLGGVAATVQEQGTYTLTISAKDGGGYTNSRSQTFTVTDNLQSDGAGGYYVNMLKTGAKEVSLVEHNSTRVYDDGGSAANFSRNADGTLLLTAAAGTVIRLTGTIDVANDTQVLTVYDGATTSAASLGTFNADGDISVVSTGTQMLLRFVTSSSGTANGLNLTATALPTASVSLDDAADNSDALALYNGVTVGMVTLADRTLYKDGAWNTLVLPFNVTAAQIAANEDFAGVEIRELSSASFDGGTLTLNFTPATGTGAVTGITAGTPCIVRWTSGTDFTPTFSGVTIDKTARDKACDLGDGKSITFTGTYDALTYADENRSILFLGNGNTLYFPDGTATTTIGACRAYFTLSGITAGDKASEARAFVLNFGDGETAIKSLSADAKNSGAWYDMSGRRLSGKPNRSGIYVNNGRKVVIK